jgi:hypothetical protein
MNNMAKFKTILTKISKEDKRFRAGTYARYKDGYIVLGSARLYFTTHAEDVQDLIYEPARDLEASRLYEKLYESIRNYDMMYMSGIKEDLEALKAPDLKAMKRIKLRGTFFDSCLLKECFTVTESSVVYMEKDPLMRRKSIILIGDMFGTRHCFLLPVNAHPEDYNLPDYDQEEGGITYAK